jgi:hypothetical protein
LLATDVSETRTGEDIEFSANNSEVIIKGVKSENITIEIYDFLGRAVPSSDIIHKYTYTSNIDISGLPAAVYFIRCSFGGKIQIAKIIKY